MIGIYERRNPFKQIHYRKELNKHLYGGVDMDVMLEMFRWLKAEDERSDVDQRFAGKDLPLVYRITRITS